MNIELENILKILNKYDIECLILSGAPFNEYEPEAKKLIKYISENGLLNIQEELCNIFNFMFSSNHSISEFKECSDEILNYYKTK